MLLPHCGQLKFPCPTRRVEAVLTLATKVASNQKLFRPADPCQQGHEELPKKFGIDMTSDMLGSVKPYRRIVSRTAVDRTATEAPDLGRPAPLLLGRDIDWEE